MWVLDFCQCGLLLLFYWRLACVLLFIWHSVALLFKWHSLAVLVICYFAFSIL